MIKQIQKLENETKRLSNIESEYKLNFDKLADCSKKIKELEKQSREYYDKTMIMSQKEIDVCYKFKAKNLVYLICIFY